MRNGYYWLGIALSIPLSILLQRFYFRDSNAAPVRPYGHLIILTHKDIPCLHIAAEKFADLGVHVLIGVKSAEMLSRFQSEAMRRKGNGDGEVLKGIETMVVDLDEPAHIANIVFRSTEMVRQLDRPLIGVVILYPESHIVSSVEASNSSLSTLQRALDIKRLEESWTRSFIAPLRIISGLLPVWLNPEYAEEDLGGRILIIQPSHVLLTRSFEYNDFIAHQAFMNSLQALQRETLHIRVSVLTASGHELGSKEIYPSVSKAIYHGMLSAHPKKYYDVGSVSIKPLPFLPAVEMPLWCWRIMNDFFPESIMEFFGVSRALRHKNQNKKSTKKTSRRRTTSRSRRVKRPLTNTYEHLVMKNV